MNLLWKLTHFSRSRQLVVERSRRLDGKTLVDCSFLFCFLWWRIYRVVCILLIGGAVWASLFSFASAIMSHLSLRNEGKLSLSLHREKMIGLRLGDRRVAPQTWTLYLCRLDSNVAVFSYQRKEKKKKKADGRRQKIVTWDRRRRRNDIYLVREYHFCFLHHLPCVCVARWRT